jgi:proton-coupled amino acid transporter
MTSNFAGAENKYEENEYIHGPISESAFRDNLTSNISKYQYLSQRGDLGFWPTLLTFIKVNLVTGFLFLPSGFKNGGWLFSCVAIFFITLFIIYCNISIAECTDPATSYSFSRIGYKAGGNFGYYCVECGIAISQISFTCGYGNIMTQVIDSLIKVWFKTTETYYIYIACGLGVILIPMCLVRKISKFSNLHIIGDISILCTVSVLAYESINSASKDNSFNLNRLPLISSGWAKLMGMCITSLEGIGVILPIKENLREKNKFNLVVFYGNLIISLILILFPLFMYMCYKENVNEIILNNLNYDKVYIQVVLILLVFSVLIVYPVQLNPAFVILENMFFEKLKEREEKTSKRITIENMMRIVIVTSALAIGIYSINKFDTMLSLVGCVVCTPLALIFPSFFHYKLLKDKQTTFRNFADITICILGIILSITVLIFTII